MTKKELRKIFKGAFSFAFLIGLVQLVTVNPVIGVIYLFYDIDLEGRFLLLIMIMLILSFVIMLISSFIVDYSILYKQKKEDTKNMEYINFIFKKSNVLVEPKKLKAYEDMFKQLKPRYYYASSIENKIMIFMKIDNADVIKIEEVDKADFLKFYEVIE